MGYFVFFLWFTLQQHGKQLDSPSKADTEEKQLQQTDSDVNVCRQPMNSPEIIKAHSEVIFASETQRSTFCDVTKGAVGVLTLKCGRPDFDPFQSDKAS